MTEEQEDELSEVERRFNQGKRDAHYGAIIDDPKHFTHHADWQNYLAGVRSYVA